MRLFSTVETSRPPQPIRLGEALLSLGSCFAETVGSRWCVAGLPGACNPCGPLFNPDSLATLIDMFMAPPERPWLEQFLRPHDGLWHSLLFHSDLSNSDRERALDRMQQALAEGHQHLAQASWLLLTWGSAQVWRHLSAPELSVGNCHRFPAAEFTLDILDSSVIHARYRKLLEQLRCQYPKLRLILSISPVRHLGQGAERNSFAKAQLITAAHHLQHNFSEQLSLFPAYEILLDELRDYRFYADDLCHPSPLAADIIWERFRTTFAEPALLQFLNRADALERRRQHRVRFPGSSVACAWQTETERLAAALQHELQQALTTRPQT